MTSTQSYGRSVVLAVVICLVTFKACQHLELWGGNSHKSSESDGKEEDNKDVQEGNRETGLVAPPNAYLTQLLRSWRGSSAPAPDMKKYFKEASHNLTVWRRNLFRKTEKTHASYQKTPSSIRAPDMFDVASSIISCPPGTELRLIGVDATDGGKWVCGVTELKAPCAVFSLGSDGNFRFEESILELTPCNVFTFDCTMDEGLKLDDKRHNFYLKCIGSEEKAAEDENFITLPQAMKLAGVQQVDLFKMDIEGFEFDVVSTWGSIAEYLDASYLPVQVVMEVHIEYLYFGSPDYQKDKLSNLLWPKTDRLSLPEIALFFSHLADLGYAVANVEKNPGCLHCAEFLLLRVQ